MALSTTLVWEVRSGGSDNNGGGFKPGASGTDYSQQNAAQYALTTVTTAAANAICLDASAAANMVGNVCQIISGTNFTPGFYEIVSVVVGVSFTLDRTCTTAAGAVGVINIGGALGSPGALGSSVSMVSSNKGWIKADGVYTLGTATPGKGGPLATTAGTIIEGYSSTRGDRAGRPEINAGAVTTVTLVTVITSTSLARVAHLTANGNSQAAVNGFDMDGSNRGYISDCLAKSCDQTGCAGFANDLGEAYQPVGCKASACTVGFEINIAGTGPVRCWADGCATGFKTGTINGSVVDCLATDCSGNGFEGPTTNTGFSWFNCVADGNTGNGFTGANNKQYINCVATNNGGYGFVCTTGTSSLDLCADYNNTSGRSSGAFFDVSPITLSGDPWTNAAADDYSPNNTAGAGASLRGLGWKVGGSGGQTDNHDISAVQHADPAGGSGGLIRHPGMRGGLNA